LLCDWEGSQIPSLSENNDNSQLGLNTVLCYSVSILFLPQHMMLQNSMHTSFSSRRRSLMRRVILENSELVASAVKW